MEQKVFFRSLFPLASAVLLFFGMPGHGGVYPLLFAALVPLLYYLYTTDRLSRVLWGSLFFGVIYNMGLLYWLYNVLADYGGLPFFIASPALFLLCLYMALFPVLFCLCAAIINKRGCGLYIQLLLLPAIWVGLDWLRSVLFTGFPWMDLGYGLYSQPLLIQAADLLGHHIITFLIVMVNLFLTTLFLDWGRRQIKTAFPLLLLCLLLVFGYSFFRFGQIQKTIAQMSAPAIASIGIVQGNIDQKMKWQARMKKETVTTYLQLSKGLVEKDRDVLLIWPETALPFYPAMSTEFARVLSFLKTSGVPLITGAPWYDYDEEGRVEYFNSALLIGRDGLLRGKYYKTHLVPFGEYVPFRQFIPFLEPLVETAGNFTAGRVEKNMTVGGVKAGILICFESVFPGMARKWVENNANILVNLTNDAWYGKSSAPYHSLAMSVLRAVETRRSVVRAANTGISGYIDPAGRVVVASEIFVPWAQNVSAVLNEEKSFYVLSGYRFGFVCFLAGILIMTFLVVRKKSSSGRE